MRVVFGEDANVAAWVAERTPHVRGAFGPCTAFGIVSERGEPLGGVVFNDWRPECKSIDVHLASTSPRWLTRAIITNIMNYPFVQLDCGRVTAITPRKATSARQFIEDFGFKREGLVRRGFGDDDAVIYGLLKHEWLRSKWNTRGRPPGEPRGERSTDGAPRTGPERGGGGADAVQPTDCALSEPAQ